MILKENGVLRRMERPAAPSRLPEKLPEKRSDAENSDERDCDVISYIRGILAEKMDGAAVVEAGGIGYRIFMPLSALELLPAVGQEAVVYTYFQVREDAMSLYGFLNRQDREMFRQLIGVNGIGPKAALGLLGALRPDDLRLAILTGDVKAISRAPGIGAKTAQRIILDLKDKVSAEEMFPSVTASDGGAKAPEAVSLTAEAAREAVDALVALGYSNLEASKAVKQVEVTEEMDAEAVLKASLKYLAFM
ncbi:Holliday junction branch migration protein RuvA [Clostridium sp. AM29-11AC]|nr:Holliday junction branch migration protein RuvA [Clostridium sp. AM29-11AC]